jgi:microcystin-dependent protein
MRTLAFLILSLSLASLKAQSVPPLMNYQGHLTDESGQPLPNGVYRVAFKLYEEPTSGTPLWQEEQNVSVVVGRFNSVLGSVNAGLGNALNGSDRFLELTVVRDAAGGTINRALHPRQQLLSAPYALMAGGLIKQLADALCPPGTVIAWVGRDTNAVPDGWALCWGQEVSRTDPNYAALFGVIGTSHGSGSTSTFKLPDFRGVFLRGVSGSSGRDPDVETRTVPANSAGGKNDVGSYQSDALERHTHSMAHAESGFSGPLNTAWGIGRISRVDATPNNKDLQLSITGGSTETRPKNVYVHYLIKL